jgi:hypothetical protein
MMSCDEKMLSCYVCILRYFWFLSIGFYLGFIVMYSFWAISNALGIIWLRIFSIYIVCPVQQVGQLRVWVAKLGW